MLLISWPVAQISKDVQIVPVKGDLGVILLVVIAMRLSVTVMELLKVGSGVMQGQFLLRQVLSVTIKEFIFVTINDFLYCAYLCSV